MEGPLVHRFPAFGSSRDGATEGRAKRRSAVRRAGHVVAREAGLGEAQPAGRTGGLDGVEN